MVNQNYERRRAGALILGAGLMSALGVGSLAFTATSAAFSGTTGTNGDFTAASVELDDDDFTTNGWTATGLIPGTPVTDCVEVEYTGDVDDLEPLRLYGAFAGTLAADLNVVVSHGAAGGTCAEPGVLTEVYNGTAAAMPADYAAAAEGAVVDTTNTTAAYQFSVEIDAEAANEIQGENATATFTWELQSS
jgi:hypothetical protein